MCHQGTQKELEFVVFYVSFLMTFNVPHLWRDVTWRDALRDRKQMKYDATKVYSLTLTFLDASL